MKVSRSKRRGNNHCTLIGIDLHFNWRYLIGWLKLLNFNAANDPQSEVIKMSADYICLLSNLVPIVPNLYMDIRLVRISAALI